MDEMEEVEGVDGAAEVDRMHGHYMWLARWKGRVRGRQGYPWRGCVLAGGAVVRLCSYTSSSAPVSHCVSSQIDIMKQEHEKP